MNIKIEYDYKKEIPNLIKKLSEKNLKRLNDFLDEINSGQQLNPKGSAVIPFNARNEEMLIFLYEQIFLPNTNISYSSSYECNDDQCFLDLSDEQNEVLRFLQKTIEEKQPKNENNESIKNTGEKLIINQETGVVLYIDQNNKEYKTKFNKQTNPYKLLMFLARNPKEEYPYDKLEKELNDPKSGGEDSGPMRRILDTNKQIKKNLGISPIKIDNGCKLDYSVQID